jgi:hypothetical protein
MERLHRRLVHATPPEVCFRKKNGLWNHGEKAFSVFPQYGGDGVKYCKPADDNKRKKSSEATKLKYP